MLNLARVWPSDSDLPTLQVLRQKESAPSTEVVTQALSSRPSPSIASPPTPPNRDSHSGDAQQEPHIVSPLSEEAARWLKGNDPTIMSASESIKGEPSLHVPKPK